MTWNAVKYDVVSTPMATMGDVVAERLLARLPHDAALTIVDVGCGTGRVTQTLLERLPHARVIALDQSAAMVEEARVRLASYAGRVEYRVADATLFSLAYPADAIFSTATFHWIPDHPALFANLRRNLVAGGWLVAQCGGFGNIAQVHHAIADVIAQPQFAPYFQNWVEPTNFATPEDTRARLEAASFSTIATSLVPQPVYPADHAALADYLRTIIMSQHVVRLPTPDLQQALADATATRLEQRADPYLLDYVRLNIDAQAA